MSRSFESSNQMRLDLMAVGAAANTLQQVILRFTAATEVLIAKGLVTDQEINEQVTILTQGVTNHE